ncbi:MAG: hypothetical protein WDM81_00910, partial [Rhizomicrobium sp.]
MELGEYFHAAHDKQAVRDEVFALICKYDFRIQATLLEKSKAMPHVKRTRPNFYQYAWYYHFKFTAPKTVGDATELMVVTASLGTKKEKSAFNGAVLDVLRQTVPKVKYAANFCPAAADPCLPVADYCAWGNSAKMGKPEPTRCSFIRHHQGSHHTRIR